MRFTEEAAARFASRGALIVALTWAGTLALSMYEMRPSLAQIVADMGGNPPPLTAFVLAVPGEWLLAGLGAAAILKEVLLGECRRSLIWNGGFLATLQVLSYLYARGAQQPLFDLLERMK